jgi:soluble lytic murein transglycosylase-like protein
MALTLLLVCASGFADDRKFSASDVRAAGVGLKKQGRIVITNDGNSITAFRFFGNVREALVSLRSARLRYTPYGNVIFDPNARVRVPLPGEVATQIATSAKTHGVDPRLVAAIARQESGYHAAAVSRVGARGIMQLMPATARFLGIANIFDIRENIDGGTRYLRTLLDTFHGDLDLALAAYNAGPGAVQKYNGIPPYRETQNYVKNVRATYEAALMAK